MIDIDIEAVISVAKRAGREILSIYRQSDAISVQVKSDNSPVTSADLVAHQVIDDGLTALTPGLPIVSEEAVNLIYEIREKWSRYWLIDPLDGTKEFLAHSDDFAVNIALIDRHEAILGVVYLPVSGDCYYAVKGQGGFKRNAIGQTTRLFVRPNPITAPLRIVISRFQPGKHLSYFLEQFKSYELIKRGSTLKICLVAEGIADIYPRLGATSEWDTAAAHIILSEAGGMLVTLDLKPLRYNTKASLINPPFLAVADSHRDWVKFLPPLIEAF